MVSQIVDPKDTHEAMPTDPGGIYAVTVLGADGREYTWRGLGSVVLNATTQETDKGKQIPVNILQIRMRLDDDMPQAVLPKYIKAVPEQSQAEQEGWRE